jgi:biotin carboxyl carrier protein
MVNNVAIEVRATSPGIVLEVPVEEGSVVEADDELLVLECMKMELPVQAPRAGTIRRVEVKVGDRVDVDDLLLTLDGRP